MKKKKKSIRILSGLDVVKQSKELGVPILETPTMMFIIMGLVTLALMGIVYLISKNSDNPILLIASEVGVVIVTFTIGGFIIRSLEEIARANKMKAEFIDIASHQMKGPLSRIKWLLELFDYKKQKKKRPTKNEREKWELLADIRDANEDMIRLANDLLDVARLSRGEKIVRDGNLDLAAIAKKVIEKNDETATKKRIDVHLHTSKDLKPITGDPRRIEVVMDNLISNAIRYTKERGKVDVSIERNSEEVIVGIKDNGIGIPENQQRHIFEKFFRADNGAAYATSGTGLGLYLARSIVDQSGGEIWFKSIENIGSLFSFSLPIREGEKQVQQPTQEQKKK